MPASTVIVMSRAANSTTRSSPRVATFSLPLGALRIEFKRRATANGNQRPLRSASVFRQERGSSSWVDGQISVGELGESAFIGCGAWLGLPILETFAPGHQSAESANRRGRKSDLCS